MNQDPLPQSSNHYEALVILPLDTCWLRPLLFGSIALRVLTSTPFSQNIGKDLLSDLSRPSYLPPKPQHLYKT